MSKTLLTWFEEKFNANLRDLKSPNAAFEKTIETIGFEPYSSYNSFQTVRKKLKFKKKEKKRRNF